MVRNLRSTADINMVPIGRLMGNGLRTVNGVRVMRFSGDIWIVPSKGGDPINLTASLQSSPKTIGYAVIDVSMESLNSAIAKGNYIALLITMIMTGLGAVSAVMIVRNIVRPVNQLENAVGKVAGGDLDQRVSIQRSDEIGSLALSFNQMTQ